MTTLDDTISAKIITEMRGAEKIVFRINLNGNDCNSIRVFQNFRFFFKKSNGDKFSRRIFFVPPHNSQRTDANTDATNNTTHTNTNKHITHFQHRYRPTSFQVARGLHSYARTVVSCMIRTCWPNSE